MAARCRVVAVRIQEAADRIEAVIEDRRHPNRGLMWWWGGGGYGWETLSRQTTLAHLLQSDPSLRACEIDLPKDREDGSLVLHEEDVRFIDPPELRHHRRER